MKNILCLVLALAMLLCASAALAEDTQSALDAANARIAELEAQVELYKPYYDAQAIIEYDGGVVTLDAINEQYAVVAAQYQQYGLDLAAYGYDIQMKQSIADQLLNDAVLAAAGQRLELDQLDESVESDLAEQAASVYENYITSVQPSLAAEGDTDEVARQKAVDYLTQYGYTTDKILADLRTNYVNDQLYAYATKDSAVDDADVEAEYNALIEEQKSSYTNDRTYNNDRSGGNTIVYNPEGYRQVKHVLIQFSDEQSERHDAIKQRISDLNAELEALNNPEEAAEETAEETEAAEETADETTEEAPETTEEAPEATEEAPEATEAPRTEEEINADLTAAELEMDNLYAELLPTAEEVIEKFNAGTPFADLIAEYNQDPGMQNEPTATIGYAVSTGSTTWDQAFTDGAMAIEEVGGISEPVFGDYGIHIILYEQDIPAGPVALEEVHSYVVNEALNDKLDADYAACVDEWTLALNPSYHYDRIK